MDADDAESGVKLYGSTKLTHMTHYAAYDEGAVWGSLPQITTHTMYLAKNGQLVSYSAMPMVLVLLNKPSVALKRLSLPDSFLNPMTNCVRALSSILLHEKNSSFLKFDKVTEELVFRVTTVTYSVSILGEEIEVLIPVELLAVYDNDTFSPREANKSGSVLSVNISKAARAVSSADVPLGHIGGITVFLGGAESGKTTTATLAIPIMMEAAESKGLDSGFVMLVDNEVNRVLKQVKYGTDTPHWHYKAWATPLFMMGLVVHRIASEPIREHWLLFKDSITSMMAAAAPDGMEQAAQKGGITPGFQGALVSFVNMVAALNELTGKTISWIATMRAEDERVMKEVIALVDNMIELANGGEIVRVRDRIEDPSYVSSNKNRKTYF
jgi:hypothetical protein